MSNTTAADLIKAPLAWVEEDATMGMADAQLALHGATQAAVLAPNGELIGIVSRDDVTLSRELLQPRMVRDHMSRRRVFVVPESPAAEALKLMLDLDIDAVPVVQTDGRVMGILTRDDFLPFAYAALGEAVRADRDSTQDLLGSSPA